MYDVAIVGAGIAGMATAARLQSRGLSTVVIEAHGQPGGCAGFFRRRGFAFDVGATTLVDFQADGVGGELLAEIGMPPVEGRELPGYVAWLPDGPVTLHRDPSAWAAERSRALGDTTAHRRFWQFLDHLSHVFWRASRQGAKLPCRSWNDLRQAVRSVGLKDLSLARYVRWTLADALRKFGLDTDRRLVGLLSMLVEDTVHSSVSDAPLINAALGITIRGAGLIRARGGMWGFWRSFLHRYRELGGELRVACRVLGVRGFAGDFQIATSRGPLTARQVVSSVPAELTAQIGPASVAQRLEPFLQRDRVARGGAIVVFLGVPDDQVADQSFTHHQLLQDFDSPLGYGNNMFISVSERDDPLSAPVGHRTVMISTHCDLESWEGLSAGDYAVRKQAAGQQLLNFARRVYPRLGTAARVFEVATPRTYERFTSRPRGAVGGVRQSLLNANQRAIPHESGTSGFWLAGDTTWPGLGTVACVLGSRIVAAGVFELHNRQAARHATAARPARVAQPVEEPLHVGD